jgi:nicotinamidase-related amidase
MTHENNREKDNKIALVVVDMQNGFLGSRSIHIVGAVLRAIEEMKTRKVPIVFTRFHNNPGSLYEKLIGWRRLRSKEEINIHPDLSPYASTVIDKEGYTAFTPDFRAMVNRNAWTTLVICGVASDGCVLKTAVDVFEAGLTPIVLKDACASHAGEEVHNAGVLLLERFIGKRQVLSTTDFLKMLDSTVRC